MRKPVVEYPAELLDDPSLPLPERVERRMARDDLDWEAWQEAYGNVRALPFGEVPFPVEEDEPGWSTPGE
ncbi:hypothetical protein ACIO3S_20935 [Nocardioides sp. NPDC087217]|uniref:hypothetical protein n=1 Tax=Nocardioides sp. NPDC087217 TaxID=3364335 RepID=UPI0037FE0460